MTTLSWIGKALVLRHPRERRAALLFALAVAIWAAVAYLALPALWRRAESAQALAGRPLVTRTGFGAPGDPINLAFLGAAGEIDCAFHAAGWTQAVGITVRSSLRIAESVLFDRPDPAAPVSTLYYDGRREDLAFEKAVGRSADRRHHIRLWRVRGGLDEIWVAAATFDAGVGFSRTTLEITHHIGADIDAERAFVVAALREAGAVADEFPVAGAGPTMNGRNGGGDRYFTDGQIAVVALADRCGEPKADAATKRRP